MKRRLGSFARCEERRGLRALDLRKLLKKFDQNFSREKRLPQQPLLYFLVFCVTRAQELDASADLFQTGRR
jgi:hypothetical protein